MGNVTPRCRSFSRILQAEALLEPHEATLYKTRNRIERGLNKRKPFLAFRDLASASL
jgi:IS4 transposase